MGLSKMVSDTRKVYDALQDNMSRFLFEKRMMYALTGDRQYILDVDNTLYPLLVPTEIVNSNKRIVMFGAGGTGHAVYNYLCSRGVNVDCVIDNNITGKTSFPVEGGVIAASNFLIKTRQNIGDYVFLIAVFPKSRDFIEIRNQLMKSNVPEESIFGVLGVRVDANMNELSAYSVNWDAPYFDLPELTFAENEVFVDGGVANGQNSIDFACYTKQKYKHIYAFEPNQYFFDMAEKRFKNENLKYTMVNKGIYSSETNLYFAINETTPEGSRIVDSNKHSDLAEIQVISLDKYFENVADKPTYIKFDIEGSELEGLIGCEHIIRYHKPKLAICIYHKNTDLLEIPQMILSFCPDYKLFIRKYWMPENVMDCEFVLFCI